MVEKSVTPYEFTPAFEQIVVRYLCNSPKFFGSVVRALEVDAFTSPIARLAVKCAQTIAADTGNGPSSYAFVVQRARRLVHQGSLTLEECDALADYFFDSEDVLLPPMHEVLSELRPILARRLQQAAVRTAIDEYGAKSEDMARTERLLHEAKTVGVVDTSAGVRLGANTLDRFKNLTQADRLSVGFTPIDVKLGGGMMRGKCGMFVGGKGMGKSMWLIHIAAIAMRRGLNVYMATLELSEDDQTARMIANLTDVPVDGIIDQTRRNDAEARLVPMLSTLGGFTVKSFPATITSVPTITSWVKDQQDAAKAPCHVLLIDYIDKCASSVRHHKSSYEIQGQAAEDMRLFVEANKLWGWTASQPKRSDKRDPKAEVGVEDVADSINKSRVMDLIMSASRPTGGDMDLFVAANRNGVAEFHEGPVVSNFAHGQFVARVSSINRSHDRYSL